jgi:tetratricopeptide (TPR) repeat protein
MLNSKDVYDHLQEIRKNGRVNQAAAYEDAVSYLRSLLKTELSEEERDTLCYMLHNEQCDYGYLDEAEKTLIEGTKLFPDNPLSWIRVCDFYSLLKISSKRSLLAADRAVEAAKKTGTFVAHAYQTQCRLAKQFGNYELLAETIEKLLDMPPLNISIDSAYESDFLIGLPFGVIDQSLIEGWNARCEQQRERKEALRKSKSV